MGKASEILGAGRPFWVVGALFGFSLAAAPPAHAQERGHSEKPSGFGPLAAPERPRSVFILSMRVVDIDDEGLGEELSGWVAQALQGHPTSYPSVATQRELEQQVSAEMMKAALDCEYDHACLAKIHEMTEADLLVTGSVGRVGRDLLLTLSVLDAKSATPLSRVGETAEEIADLHGKMKDVVARLFRMGRAVAPEFRLPYRDGMRLGLFQVDAAGVEKDTVQNLSQLMAVELAKVRGAEVISPEDVEAILGKAKYDEMVTGDCLDACIARLAGALNVEYILVGQIGRFDRDYVVSLRLIDQRAVRVVNRVTETFRGPEDELGRAVRTLTRRVVGATSEGRGSLAVSGPVGDAEVTLGTEVVGRTPWRLERTLRADRVTVQVSKKGYLDWRSDVFVQPGEDNLVWAELERAPKSIFEAWWFWSLVGAAVVGGTAAGVVLTQSSSSGSGDVGLVRR